MGRGAAGVRGINLDGGYLVGMEIAKSNEDILVVTEKGYGKKTPVDEYRITNRGGKGVKTINVAFDVTDASLITAFITEKGVISPSEIKKYITE